MKIKINKIRLIMKFMKYKVLRVFSIFILNKLPVLLYISAGYCLGRHDIIGAVLIILYIILIRSILKNLNDYTCVNRMTGAIHMRSDINIKKIKNMTDLELQNLLHKEFLSAIKSVPEKTKYCFFRLRKKNINTKTHKLFCLYVKQYINRTRNIDNEIENKISITELRKGIIAEKLFKYDCKSIMDLTDKDVERILKKSSKYYIEISIDCIKNLK